MLIAVCSLKGSPGVTTAAVALAGRWPVGVQPIVVECDPAGGDLLARFRLEQAPGLVSLAAAARRHPGPQLIWQHIQQLPGGLPVVVGPVGAEQARAALAEITAGRPSSLRAAADQPGTVVIADCGRVDPDSPALAVIRSADVMLLLAHARDDQLAHVAGKLHIAGRWARTPCLVLVGDGYPNSEVSRALRINIMGRIPHDPKGASILCGQSAWRHQLSRTALGRATAGIARLAAHHVGWTPPASAEPAPATANFVGTPAAPMNVAVSPNGVRR
jgi:hypothetical protein